MSNLDATVVGLHCQTCLSDLQDSLQQNAINVLQNVAVRQLIEKYGIAKELLDIPGYPQHICIQCYNTLANFDAFCEMAKGNAVKLQNLLNSHEFFFENEPVCVQIAAEEQQKENEKMVEEEDDEEPADDSNETNDFNSSDDDFLNEIVKISPKTNKETVKISPIRRSKRVEAKSEGSSKNSLKISFKCSQCGLKFERIKQLDEHIRKKECPETIDPHAEPEPKRRPIIKLIDNTPPVREAEKQQFNFKCPEENCNKIFHSLNGLKRHKVSHSSKLIETFICEQCGVTYNSTSSLKWHMKEKHPTDEQRLERERNKQLHKCEHCGKEYLNIYKLKYHIKERHTDEKPFKCPICGVRKAMKHILQQHMKCHDELAKMPCEYCGRPFTRKFELQEHVRAVHLKLRPFECKYCNDSFACRKTLRHHEYIHTGEKPYICDICGIAYRQRSCLRNHKKTHEQLPSAPVENLQPPTLMDETNFIIEQIISNT